MKENFGDKINTGGFDKNPKNINKKGRPPKIYNVLRKTGFSKEDIEAAFSELAFYTISELKELISSDDVPIIVNIVGKALVEAAKDGKYALVKDILEQVVGKSTAKVEIEEINNKPSEDDIRTSLRQKGFSDAEIEEIINP